jgi:hypothetical protein
MLIYWVLFGTAMAMCLLHRAGKPVMGEPGAGERIVIWVFALLYVVVGGFRLEVGADWRSYLWMYTQISYSSLGNAVIYTDPLFGLLNWISARLDFGVYFVNLVVCAILVSGVIRMARSTRDPWLAILIAVPYVLIVIGFGYVRQAAAIGMLLHAIVALEQRRRLRTIIYLVLAAGFHTTSLVVAPFFLIAISKRIDFYAILLFGLATLAFFLLLEPRLDTLEARYIVAEYQSQGTLVRLLMSALPAALLLIRWKHFELRGPSRPVWLLIAIASLAILAAYVISPSSTAVDRIGLYFSIIQIVVFGELLYLINFKQRDALYIRVMAVALAIAVQTVWLTSADHLRYWVPYQSILFSD